MSLHPVDQCEVLDIISADRLALRGAAYKGILKHRFAIIIRGVDREVRSDVQMDTVLSKDLCAEAVKRSDVRAFLEPWHKVRHPRFHLVGGLVRECQSEDAEILLP